jgi:VCBS repeat-containing protein
MNSLRVKLLPVGIIVSVLALLLLGIPSSSIYAASVIDSWNATFNPAGVATTNNQDDGWLYTPTISYTLSRIEAKFDQTTASVTVQFYSGTPGTGGFTLLANATFTPTGTNTWSGGNLNTTVNVVSGTTYFVGFRNVPRTPTTNNTVGTIQYTLYTSTNPSNYGTLANGATASSHRPIVRFIGNRTPAATNDSYSVNENTTLTANAAAGVLANDTDADGDTLTAAVVANVTHGSLTLNANGSFTYTPTANYVGSDSFTYRANDGTTNSNTATVTITVNAVNHAPVAAGDSYSTNEDTVLTVNVASGVLANDTDADGNTLTAGVVSGVSHGSLTLNANGSFSYTPNANFHGGDSFTYQANDGTTNSNTATVTITVNSVNDAPVANDDSYSTNEDTPLLVNTASGVVANDTDVDGDPLTLIIVTAPSHGLLFIGTGGDFGYTPDANYNGSDSFTYYVNDGTTNSNTATVTITVNAVDDAPVTSDDSYSTNEDTPLTVDPASGVLANDSDVDSASFNAVLMSVPAHGSLTLFPDGSFSYTPDANFNGGDSFTYQANDGTTNSNTATVTITVNSVNDAPVASDDSYSTNEDTPLTVDAASGVLANDSDVDSASLNVTLVGNAAHGSLALLPDGSFSYTPDANYNGSDSFSYVVDDGALNSNPATVTITVNAVDDAPAASDDSYSTDDVTTLTVDAASGVLANDSDIDSGSFNAVLVSSPASGSVALNGDGSFIYTPTSGFSGTDTFTYQADDGTNSSNIATVTISVSTYARPTAADDSYAMLVNKTLTVAAPGVLANDTNPGSSSLDVVLVVDVSNGILALSKDGSFTFTPTANFTGVDTFTYKTNDGKVDSNTATVTITVKKHPATVVVEVPAPPPATLCSDTNFENPGMIRSNFTSDIDRAGLYCRLIAADGSYMSWLGSPLTNSGNVGNQSVLDLGVVSAVDVFSMIGVTGFAGDVDICLKGSGYIIYLNANGSPRIPQLWSTWTTDAFPGYTCTTLYAPGTVVLVTNKPQ